MPFSGTAIGEAAASPVEEFTLAITKSVWRRTPQNVTGPPFALDRAASGAHQRATAADAVHPR